MSERRRLRAAVLTVSDSAAAGEREDISGPLAAKKLYEASFEVDAVDVAPDDLEGIKQRLVEYCERGGLDLVVTTGGTGFAPRDLTPEATAQVVERRADGLLSYVRFRCFQSGPKPALSRGIAGIRGSTLIVNLPGSPRAVEESLGPLLDVLEHALRLLAGEKLH